MKAKKRRTIISIFLIVCMMMTIPVSYAGTSGGNSSPAPITGNGSSTVSTDGGLELQKEAQAYDDGTVKITLDAYAKPIDFVLVLDVSGSMNKTISGKDVKDSTSEKSRIQYLKDAAKQFVNEAASRNPDNRISIVKYAGKKSDQVVYGNSSADVKYAYDSDTDYAYSQIVCDYLQLNSDNADNLCDLIDNKFFVGGPTSTDYGIDLAEAVINGSSSLNLNGSNEENNKSIIFFSDGEPEPHDSLIDKTAVENQTINKALSLKNNNVSIYSIYVGPDKDVTSEKYRFLDYLSSNYPDAANMTTPGKRASTDYFASTTNSTELNNAFIYALEKEAVYSTAGFENGALKDVISSEFKYVEGSLKAWKVPCTGFDAEGNATWASDSDWGTEGVGLTKTVNGSAVSVKGFDYKTNCVSSTKKADESYGAKLHVEFFVEPVDKNITAPGNIKTNKSASVNDPKGNPVVSVDSPEVEVGKVKYDWNGYTPKDVKLPDSEYLLVGENYTVDTTIPDRDPKLSIRDEKAKKVYTFNDWYDNASGGNPIDNVNISEPKEYTIYGNWSIVDMYNVTYDLDGGKWKNGNADDFYNSINAPNDTVSVTSIEPEKKGYDFTGWKEVTNEKQVYTSGASSFTMPKRDVELKANWKIHSNKITYKYENDPVPDGADPVPVVNNPVDYNTTIKIADEPSLPGYTFVGWTPEDGDVPVDKQTNSFTMPDKDVVLVGKFVPNSWTVSYQYKNGYKPIGATNLPLTKKYNYNDTVDIAKDSTAEGYYFSGWKTENVIEDNITNGQFRMPNNNVLFIGEWSPIPHNVIYEVKNAPEGAPEKPSDTSVPYNTTTYVDNKYPDKVVPGYKFSGWTPVTTGVEVKSDNSFTMPNKDVTFEGTWTPISYNVTYKFDRSKGPVPSGVSLPKGNSNVIYNTVIDVDTTTKDVTGYTFSGWKPETDNVTISNNQFNMPAKDVVLVGYWESNKHPVTYSYVGTYPPAALNDLPQDKDNVSYGTQVVVEKNPKDIPGYEFSGWTSEQLPDNPGPGEAFNMPDKPVVFTGKWTKVYKVTYRFDTTDYPVPPGVILPSGNQNIKYNDTVSVDTTTKNVSGYVFSGWTSEDSNITIKNNKFTMPNHDVELVGKWTPVNDVIYEYSGKVPENVPNKPDTVTDVKSGDPVTVAKKPDEIPGYDFVGWTPKDNIVTIDQNTNGFTMPDKDVVLVGEWVPEQYDVTYEYEGDVPSGAPALPKGNKDVDYGSSVTVETNPTLSGYTFSGWSTKDVAGNPTAGQQFNMPNNDVVFVGKWTVKQSSGGGGGGSSTKTPEYTLTYVSNGGTTYSPQTEPKNTTINIDKTPIKPGYTFTGWYSDPELTTPIDKVTLKKDTTVYAGWEKTTTPDALNADDHFAYIIGYDDGLIHPNFSISRAEVATIFFRLLDNNVRDMNISKYNQFSDVTTMDWFNTAISTMSKLGIISGFEGKFRPNEPITRAEFAAIATRFDNETTDKLANFNDISEHWAKYEISKAAERGWVNGYADGSFRPDQLITRAEAMALINRVLVRDPEYPDDLLNNMVKWPDNLNTGAWYYLDVQEATNSHDYQRKTNTREHWTAITPPRDWSTYEKVEPVTTY